MALSVSAVSQRQPGARLKLYAGRWAAGVGTAVALGIVLEVLVVTGALNRETVPSTTSIIAALGEEVGSATFWSATGYTMGAWAVGLAIAFVASLPAGMAVGRVRALQQATKVLIEFFRPIPGVTVLPLLVMVIGLNLRMEVALIAVGAFWPLLYQVIYGTQGVDPVTLDVARAYRLPRWLRVSRVIMPSTAPYVATGLRISASIALIVAIGTELIVGQSGLGTAIYQAQYAGKIPAMYALIVATGIIGVIVNALFRRVERTTLRWQPSSRDGVSWR